MLFEDAHWIDPTSRDLLDLMIERVRNLRVLLIVTFRPEFRPPWTGESQVSMVVLNRPDRRDQTALVEQIAGGKALPHEIVVQKVASGLVSERGTLPHTVYAFKHALVQDAAHGSLLRKTRQQLHAQIAEALETNSPELMDIQPELFAQHYAEAGLVEKIRRLLEQSW